MPRADRRLGGPDRLERQQDASDKRGQAARLHRQLHPLRRSRARHGRRDERHGAARRDWPYGGTFLVFTDYCRPSIRLSALMGQRVIYVMTHDSIGLGEDGPTHQPVEHLAALRAMPNLHVFRPADSVECAECWELALASADDALAPGADPPEPAGAAGGATTTPICARAAPTSCARRTGRTRRDTAGDRLRGRARR